jgi:hypothetical protein
MNAKQARKRSMKNIESILWEQVSQETRDLILDAVANETQDVQIDIRGKRKAHYYGMREDAEKLRMLGYDVYDNGGNDRGVEVHPIHITISW